MLEENKIKEIQERTEYLAKKIGISEVAKIAYSHHCLSDFLRTVDDETLLVLQMSFDMGPHPAGNIFSGILEEIDYRRDAKRHR